MNTTYPKPIAGSAMILGVAYAWLTFFPPVTGLTFGMSWSIMLVVAFIAAIMLADMAYRLVEAPSYVQQRIYRTFLIWSVVLFVAPVVSWRLIAFVLVQAGVVTPL